MDNKGYMLVEIILASALAFGIAYFILDLTLGMKNKNDDLLIETMVNTDRTIITNKLMDYAITETEDFDCSKLKISGKNILYKGKNIDIINDYADVGRLSCKNEAGKITINIPLDVKQMPEADFDINLDYKYKIGDMIPPTCSLTITGNSVKASYSDNDGGSGIKEYGISNKNTPEYNNNDSMTLGVNTYYCYVIDNANNEGSKQLEVINTTAQVSGQECIQYIPYCNYACSYYGNPRYYNNVAWCQNPSPGNCGQTASWYDCAGYRPTYSYVCPSGYTKLNDTYCYK